MNISSLKAPSFPGEIKKPVEGQPPKSTRSPIGTEEQNFTSKQVGIMLDKMMKNTKFQYVIDEKINYFIVKIIDKETDKVIREIPSRELQRFRKGIEKTLGILFDDLI